MVQAGRSGGYWRSVRDLPKRTPLRVKLITALLALVAVALLVISVAGIGILRNDLLGPPDADLSGAANSATVAVGRYLATGARGSQPGLALDWISAGKIQEVIQPTAGAFGSNGFGPNGLTPTRPMSGPELPTSSSFLAAHSGSIITVHAQTGGARWRVLLQSAQFNTSSGPVTGTIALAFDVSSVYTTIGQLATIDFFVSVILLLGLLVIGVAVVRRSLRPLTDIEQTAGAIAAGDLSRRVPERDPRTEVGRLGRSLNAMLSQIESAFHARARSEESARRSEEKMRQFVADASHELRTPLTAIRGFAEYYRQRGGIDMGSNGTGKLAPADLDRIMRRVEQEASRMGILVEDMLLLARLDQQRPLEARPVDLLSLAADAVHDARVVAPNRSIHLTVGSGAALLVIGDEVRLRQVIGNLMSNALSHTPDGTPIDVLIRSGNLDEAPAATTPAPPPPPEPARAPGESGQFSVGAVVTDDTPAADDTAAADGAVAADDTAAADDTVADRAPAEPASEWQARAYRAGSQPAAVLEVIDHGPGLTRDQANHVFERFYRADQARTAGGTGLGLAIVAALVAAHGGATWVRSQPGQGATFCIALPLSPEAVQGSDDEFADADDAPDEIEADHDTDWARSDRDGQHVQAAAVPGHGLA
jgi:two-component system OmpR family sensor kinase